MAIDPTLKNVESYMLFQLNLRADVEREWVAEAHRMAGAAITRASQPAFAAWSNSRDPDRRLRVGYVSGDFGFHPVGLFIQPMLENHDKTSVEVYCYSNNLTKNPTLDRARAAATVWRDIAGMDDNAVAAQVREDVIDILVDLSGHTDGNRLPVFAKHPAPLQLSWLGYLNTTGLAAMDYRICDRHTDPPGTTEHLHTERLLRLPHSQWCYVPWGNVPLVDRPHPEHADELVFGSFNHSRKLNPFSVDLWSRVLHRLPEARLVVLDIRDVKTRQTLLDRFAHNRVDTTRIELRGRENLANYYRAVGNVDIAFDAYPYNGATTSFDVLWMGVPFVALRGDRGIARGGASILSSLGLPRLVADSPDEYVEVNVKLAYDGNGVSSFAVRCARA